MRNIIIFGILIILFSIFYQNFNLDGLTGHVVYKTGESFETGGKSIIVSKISQSSVVFEIGGVKGLVGKGDKKIINGVRIEVLNIFYVDEEEERSVEISVSAISESTCGDGKCQSNEDSKNCCKDCGCQSDYKCEENKCEYSPKNECRKHEDCEDNNPDTIDLCVDLTPKVCKHYSESEIKAGEGFENETSNQTGIISEGEEEKTTEEKPGFFARIFLFFKNLL